MFRRGCVGGIGVGMVYIGVSSGLDSGTSTKKYISTLGSKKIVKEKNNFFLITPLESINKTASIGVCLVNDFGFCWLLR